MLRKNFYITERQYSFLEKVNEITVSEHIRRAIDEYIVKLMNQTASVSPSQPLKKEGKHGK